MPLENRCIDKILLSGGEEGTRPHDDIVAIDNDKADLAEIDGLLDLAPDEDRRIEIVFEPQPVDVGKDEPESHDIGNQKNGEDAEEINLDVWYPADPAEIEIPNDADRGKNQNLEDEGDKGTKPDLLDSLAHARSL